MPYDVTNYDPDAEAQAQAAPVPIAAVVRELAYARQALAADTFIYDAMKASFEVRYAVLINRIASNKASIATLESEIRRRGAEIAAWTHQAPAPGTKVRFQKVLRYVQADSNGELVTMDASLVADMMTNHIIDHGWTSMLKPDRTAWEKAIKSLPETERPDCVREEWETVVSIDKDLSVLLDTADTEEGAVGMVEEDQAPGE